MIVVTGATGFIGSNVCEFIQEHHSDKNIIVVDTFDDDNKLKNLSNINIKDSEVYEKLVTRCLFGNINAARNSASRTMS